MVFNNVMQCHILLIDRNNDDNNCKLCNLLISNCCQLRNNFFYCYRPYKIIMNHFTKYYSTIFFTWPKASDTLTHLLRYIHRRIFSTDQDHPQAKSSSNYRNDNWSAVYILHDIQKKLHCRVKQS